MLRAPNNAIININITYHKEEDYNKTKKALIMNLRDKCILTFVFNDSFLWLISYNTI